MASATMFLAPYSIRKVMAIDVSEVVGLWKLFIWDVVSYQISFGPCLGAAECLFESGRLGISGFRNLCETKWFIAVCAIIFVVLLEHANICFPRGIFGVVFSDFKVCYIRWNMRQHWIRLELFTSPSCRRL